MKFYAIESNGRYHGNIGWYGSVQEGVKLFKRKENAENFLRDMITHYENLISYYSQPEKNKESKVLAEHQIKDWYVAKVATFNLCKEDA